MNLFLNRHSPVPIHDQLVAQIGQLVASGSLAPGQKLPSIRRLAQRLDVHPNTVAAAYKSLEERGVLVIRKGSGAHVAELSAARESWRQGLALRALAEHFVAQARAGGHEAADILAACRDALEPRPIARLVVVNPHPDLQDLYRFELSALVGLAIAGMALEDVAGETPQAIGDSAYLTSTNHAAALQRLLGEQGRVIVLRLASVEPLIERVRALPQTAVVAVVSASERIRFLVPEMLAGVRQEENLLVADLTDERRRQAVLKLADLVVTDAAAYDRLVKLSRKPVYRFQLLAADMASDLAKQLPATAFLPDRQGACGH